LGEDVSIHIVDFILCKVCQCDKTLDLVTLESGPSEQQAFGIAGINLQHTGLAISYTGLPKNPQSLLNSTA